jgi:hypothetical protein
MGALDGSLGRGLTRLGPGVRVVTGLFQAAWRHSWMRLPRTSMRSTSPSGPGGGSTGWAGGMGGSRLLPRCGRAVL